MQPERTPRHPADQLFIPHHDWGQLPQPTVMMLDKECQDSANTVLQAWALQPPFC